MDKIDREIVRLLEDDARISFAELGERVGLSKTPCWQRVRELERRGLIRGYRAELDAESLGLRVHAFVHVTINAARHAEFEAAAKDRIDAGHAWKNRMGSVDRGSGEKGPSCCNRKG